MVNAKNTAEEKGKVKVVWKGDREVWVGENRYYLGENNIFYITPVGEFDEKIALAVKEVMLEIFNMVEGKINLMVDLNKAEKHSSEARKIVKEITENEKTGKAAIFGMHPVARVLASFIMGISKKKDMRFFKTKEGALAWLKEK